MQGPDPRVAWFFPRTQVSPWPFSPPCGPSRCAPHTPLSSVGPSAAGPGPAQQLPRHRADSRTACRVEAPRSVAERSEVEGRDGWQVGRAGGLPGGGGGEEPVQVPESCLMGCLCALPEAFSFLPPNPIPELVTPQELALRIRTRGLRKQHHDPNSHHVRASSLTLPHLCIAMTSIIIYLMFFFKSGLPLPLLCHFNKVNLREH